MGQEQDEELPYAVRIIKEAVSFGNTSPLFDALAGFYGLRSELLRSIEVAEHPDALRSELRVIEEMMGRIIVYLDPGKAAAELHLRGVVASRGDVYRLVPVIYDQMDAEQYPPKEISLVGVAGQIASGKGSVGDIVHSKYKSMHLPLSDRLREVAASQGVFSQPDRATLRKINDDLKPRFGNPVFVRWTIERAQTMASIYKDDVMTFDGFRSAEEAQLFKDRGGKLIAIEASPETRYQRLLERNRGSDDFDRDVFNASDEIEQQWINPVLALADIVIQNEGTIDELTTAVLAYCEKILPKSALRD